MNLLYASAIWIGGSAIAGSLLVLLRRAVDRPAAPHPSKIKFVTRNGRDLEVLLTPNAQAHLPPPSETLKAPKP